jgi:hypothetical protein
VGAGRTGEGSPVNQDISLMQPAGGPDVERQVVVDMTRRALPFVPVLLLLSALVWGINGALSAGVGVALVLLNLSLSAAMLAWAARISLVFLMATALFGYLLRLGLITAVVLAIHSQPWVSIVPLGLTIIVTHLGLLLWETRYISASLAFPAVKPSKKGI